MTPGEELPRADQRDLGSKTEMNLLTNFEGVFEALCQIESGGQEGKFTEDLRKDLEEAVEDVKEHLESGWDDEGEEIIVADFYGAGGVHRYGVTNEGKVKFSRMHAGSDRPEEVIARAEALGFETY